MKLGLIIMLWIIGLRINGGSIYWIAYSLFVFMVTFGDSK